MPMNLILLAMVCKPLENTILSNHPCTSELLWYFWFPVEKSQHIIGTTKENEFGCIREGKEEEFDFTCIASAPRRYNSGPDEISAHDFSRGLSESMGVNASLPQLCGALPKRLSSISPHPEYGVMSHGGWEETERGR